jgi:tetratricopeptide (TPR) repeat protein
VRAAFARFTTLLARIEIQPEGTPLGRGSYEHCLALFLLARCLRAGGQPTGAEKRLREALTIAEALLTEQPENESCIRQRGLLLTDLGYVLSAQGKYSEAQRVYEEALSVAEWQRDLLQQDVVQTQLGMLALLQRDYAEAQSCYRAALDLDRTLGEPAREAIAWHQLGMVAQKQKEWAEAEHCYRESLTLRERVGDTAGVAQTCNQLAIVSSGAGRPTEAEAWFKQALEMYGRVQRDSSGQANILSNLAALLKNEVRAGRIPATRLAEARGYAEQALAIRETLDVSSEIWMTLSILADIAEMEGQTEVARAYRPRGRETFAAFAGNRWHIDQQFRELIEAIAVAAKGDMQAREAVEKVFPELEADGWQIATATRRIWAGEREWHALVEGVGRDSALLVLRVLERLSEGSGE